MDQEDVGRESSEAILVPEVIDGEEGCSDSSLVEDGAAPTPDLEEENLGTFETPPGASIEDTLRILIIESHKFTVKAVSLRNDFERLHNRAFLVSEVRVVC